MESKNTSTGTYHQIGVSRPALEVVDLPTPEETFKLKRIGLEELLLIVLGPSLIALGISIGSGEWLLGPLNVSKYGFEGIGWIILVSAILQVFYNVELGRFTLATGESPILAFGRVPPGFRVWVPLALFCFFLAFILGGWTVSAGASLFAVFAGRAYTPEELETVRFLGIGLLLVSSIVVLFGRKIEQTLEAVMGIIVIFIIISLVLVVALVVPLSYSGKAILSLVTITAPPPGTDVSLLGALAGFTALASGLNFMFIGLYRDKGYGMGYKTGYIAGLIGGKQPQISPSGKTFPENDTNAATWKRWFRFLVIDQWVIYFTGCLIGIMAPSILVGYLASIPGAAQPTQQTILIYAATELGKLFGPFLVGWALLLGFLILFKTQLIILELLTRNLTDAAYGVSSRFRNWVKNDPRRFYYPLMLILIVIIGIMIHIGLPEQLIVFSGNLSNLASMIFPLAMIYLNRQLPRPAKIAWWSYLVLVLNVLFFGFFFINFVAIQLTGTPLIKF